MVYKNYFKLSKKAEEHKKFLTKSTNRFYVDYKIAINQISAYLNKKN